MQTIPNASDILLAVIDATPDAISVKDLDGRYVLVNQDQRQRRAAAVEAVNAVATGTGD